MHRVFHFRTQLNDLRTTTKLRTLVTDLHLQVHFLDRGIHDEEQRTGSFDVTDVAYPILAQSLRTRRENLLATIRVLESRMAEAQHEAGLETNHITRATQSSEMIRRAQV